MCSFLFQSIGIEVTDAQIEVLLDRLDENKDGDIDFR
jgi:Ca2+-binding EF-hand superfamily protein